MPQIKERTSRSYSTLRKMGHGRVESLKMMVDFYFENLVPFPYTTYDAFCVEDDLRFLEQCSEPDFQSLNDIVNLPPNPGLSEIYRTKEELSLVHLQLAYCNHKELFSKYQAQRYENLLKQLPPKFEELINAATSRDRLKEYEGRKKRETQKKRGK